MKKQKKRCSNCHFSYKVVEDTGHKALCCRNPRYNSNAYTTEMMLEDWDLGRCRFWTPKKVRKGPFYEKQLFRCRA